MSTVETPGAQKKTTRPKPKKEPGAIRIRSHRARTRLTEPPRVLASDAQRRHADRKARRKAPKWRRRPTKAWTLELLTYGLTLVLALWVLRAIGVVVVGKSWSFPFNPDQRCEAAKIGVSCGAISGLVMTVFSLALASAVFLFWRLRHVRGPYVKRAKDKEGSRALVQTAGKIVDDVVGRSKLCDVILDDLRDPDKRPHLIVGGVGSGKTAVLLKLTRVLAENRAVPVPIRLRDAQDDLNFEGLARTRFIEETTRSQMSDAEGGKVWRRLIREKQIVVLADGLEEALMGNPERDSLIRLAVDEAHRDGLALVIASRPHEAITGLDVATIDLEPLSEEAAIDYICEVSPTSDERRIDWVVETAEVTETPLYLQIARELHRYGLLERAELGREEKPLDTRSVDRAELRVRLMWTWTEAVIRGYLKPDLPISADKRRSTVKDLAALACIGLKQDTLEVKFDELVPPADTAAKRQAAIRTLADLASGALKQDGLEVTVAQLKAPLRSASKPRHTRHGSTNGKRADGDQHPTLLDALEHRGISARRHSQVELRQAAARGERLGLVEMSGDRVRFPHSMLQAYLASRLIGTLVGSGDGDGIPDPGWLDDALKNAGRELLVALVMHTRSELGRDRGYSKSWVALRERLVDAADRSDAKSLDLLGAALEIDSVDAAPAHNDISQEMYRRWADVVAEDRTAEDAKLNAVARLAQAARKIAERREEAMRQGLGEPFPAKPAYDTMFKIGACEESYAIRLAITQEIGDGGDAAYDAVGWRPIDADGELPVSPSSRRGDRANELLEYLAEPSLKAPGDPESTDPVVCHNVCVMRAWLAPLLFSSTRVGSDQHTAAQQNLDAWVALVQKQDQAIPLSLEIALAQGFKHAANRRPQRAHTRNGTAEQLAEQAMTMLKHASFWFSQLTLIQALCLWGISDAVAAEADSTSPERDRRGPTIDRNGRSAAEARANGRPARGALTSAEALADHWLSLCGKGATHPFLIAIHDLVVSALATRKPDRFLWIDESGVIGKVGSRSVQVGVRRKHSRWIPPSAGWSALDPAAQQLVADVLLMLNLAERGDDPQKRDARLGRTNRNDLPPCVRGNRDPLDPRRTVGMVGSSAPGSNCASGCRFELCPYPPKGESSYRAELSEAFCRRQQALLTGPRLGRRTAPWQGALSQELKRFWEAMEQRARR